MEETGKCIVDFFRHLKLPFQFVARLFAFILKVTGSIRSRVEEIRQAKDKMRCCNYNVI